MEPEGMVHALEIIKGLLHPGSFLIDIHPTSEPPPIQVIIDNQPQFAGLLQETDDFIEYTRAEQALEEAVKRGWFLPQASEHFTFRTYAPSPDILFEFLRAEWKDALLLPEVIAQAQALYQQAGAGSQTVLTEQVRITRYLKGD